MIENVRIRWPKAALALALATLGLLGGAGTPSRAESAKPARAEDGKYFDAHDSPTYNIVDNKVDWYTYSGYRRYHSECHVCHGPNGAGSTYAPALADSLKTMSYETFTQVVIQGKQEVNQSSQKVMPAFGTNQNVACYLDDIYVYLKARADGALGRVRPAEHDDKPQTAKDNEKSCIGS